MAFLQTVPKQKMCWSGKGAETVNSVVKVGFLGKVTFHSKYEGGEKPSLVVIRGKNILGRRSSKCKGPEVRMCLVMFKMQGSQCG